MVQAEGHLSGGVLTPRQLSYFLRIAELGSFTKAAAVLHVAQPALSRQMQQLEDDLNVRLFVRSDSGVSVTEAGEALRARAVSLLEQFAAVRDEVAALSDRVQGRLHVGMPPSLFDLVTVPLMVEIHKKYPAVHPCLIEGISSAIYELVLAGRVDFGVVLSTESLHCLSRRDLFSEQLYFAFPPGAGPNDCGSVSLAEVAEQPLVLTQSPNAMRQILDDALRGQGLTVTTVLETNSTRAHTDLVAAGIGCSVVSYSALANDLHAGRLNAVPIDDLRVTWTLVHSKERALGLAAQKLVETLLEVAKNAEAEGRWPGMMMVPSASDERTTNYPLSRRSAVAAPIPLKRHA